MNLSRLNWVKVVTPESHWRSKWAYTAKELESKKNDKENVINDNGVVIFPLEFKNLKANDPKSGDLILLTQRAKVTHIVEVLDHQSFQSGEFFNRYVRVIWWKSDSDNLENLPHQDQVLGFHLNIQQSMPYKWESLKDFQEKWKGEKDKFQIHLAMQIEKL
ncbi:hypothetical protein [Cyanobacterium aponinum]|uniref:hypothetical protein n=1 Tax=Cyanobacterium aponinum TaxID=379064 RepID=UPI000C12C683|nr:hypothetical protein [Cyanobacterium aponinum]PHV63583.1 hypothetical protein CSQ80_04430 [Cyanobacterium aponinum IPPAS B-1201]